MSVSLLQPIAPFAESASDFECPLCGFRFCGFEEHGPVRKHSRGPCARCSRAQLFNSDDVKRRTMPKCRIEHTRPYWQDGDATA